MKKVISVVTFLIILLFINFGFVSAEEADFNIQNLDVTVVNVDDLQLRQVGDKIELTSDKVKVLNVTHKQTLSTFARKSYTAGYEIEIPLEKNTIGEDRDVDGSSKYIAGVKAELYVDYDVSSNNEKIRVNRIYGSWKPGDIYYLISRKVGCHSGSGTGKLFQTDVSTNSFSYSLNWGYNVRLWGPLSPRAWSEAVSRVSGMSGTYLIKIEFPFS
ncbi:hypothetical protein H1220_00305 [Carnobacteriaceae bacterium zg-84]|uniref:hypothetical protein n=1 Tax=Granulicatella sp. zg-84 TaxID=2678503 RepID=UPI0013C01837|nr:hypothetical protein [Granulicatella sp. zg-84]NEW65990.1 hypothetical protein [Granulicatella sp. zg-84]QMI85866.1 hypothetical protein H1220_00305 [Carnobacteriaceae bacterium zg-84]